MRNSAPRSTEAPAKRPPPAALPGLQGRRAPEPIPGDPTQSLPPNAALFDAINRGDLPAARDAVARGADTEARNVLGLTPVDAAVDQGRTEIMFYLLSVRGAPRIGGPPPEAEERPASAASRRREAARRRTEEPPRPAPVEAQAPVPQRAALGRGRRRAQSGNRLSRLRCGKAGRGGTAPGGGARARRRPEHNADGDGAGLRTAGRGRHLPFARSGARECLAGSEVATLESRDMPQVVRSFPPAPPPRIPARVSLGQHAPIRAGSPDRTDAMVGPRGGSA